MIDLLRLVLPAIRLVVDNQGFEYQTYVGETVDESGLAVPKYSSWKKCEGSVQPMDAHVAEKLGLDFAERGILVWGSIDFNTLDTQDHPDRVRYKGRVFICRKCTDWYVQNGWNAFACTEDKRDRSNTSTAGNPTPSKSDVPTDPGVVPPIGGGQVAW